ncbi:hypothetical protein [Actinomadura hibisca]|uniref:hypothetical protein n=1 Tax=Actinomadura hibisca TaxID=68565 RepID=UPI0012FC92F5|nr:hypothetical protein [Actinomadura hibisca]
MVGLLKPLSAREPQALSLCGSLYLFGAIAHARTKRSADAWRMWDQADEVSRLLRSIATLDDQDRIRPIGVPVVEEFA